MKKTICRLLLIFLSVAILASCQAKEAVMSCGNHSITEGEFKYYISTYKGQFARIYSDFSDSEDFYSKPAYDSGISLGEYLYDIAVKNIKMTLVANSLCDEYGLKLNNSAVKTIDDYIDDYISEYSNGNKNAFNQAIGVYGVNVKMLREIYLRDEHTGALFSYLYGEGGKIGVTDSDRAEYLEENYARIRHIYVNNKFKYSTDNEGNAVYTEEGLRKTEDLSENELAAKNELISAIDDSLSEGGDFAEIYEAMSEDKLYPGGYYLTKSTDFISEVVSAAFELNVGEYTKVESQYGTHYVMRLEMEEKPWSNSANGDFFDNYDDVIANKLFAELIESKISDVQCDEDFINGYSLVDFPINYRF